MSRKSIYVFDGTKNEICFSFFLFKVNYMAYSGYVVFDSIWLSRLILKMLAASGSFILCGIYYNFKLSCGWT